jgi:hypothetical protein
MSTLLVLCFFSIMCTKIEIFIDLGIHGIQIYWSRFIKCPSYRKVMIFITKLQTNRCFCEHESASIGFKKPRNPRPSATSEIHHSFRRCPSYFECGKLPPPPKKFKLILIYIYLQKELDVFSKVNKQLKKKKGSGRQSFINWWVGVQKKGSSSKILMKVFSLSRYTLATHSTLFTWEVRLSYSFQGGQQAIHCIQFPFALFHYSQLN